MTELDPKTLWQSQATAATPIPLDEIKRRARWSVRIIRLRNGADHLGNIGVAIWLLVFSATIDKGPAFQVACLVGIPPLAISSWLIWKNASVLPAPATASAQEYLRFQRAQLRRQLNGVHMAWIWYLGPLLVIVPAFIMAYWIEEPDKAGWASLAYLVMSAFAAALTLAINAVRAARLRRMMRDFEGPEAGD